MGSGQVRMDDGGLAARPGVRASGRQTSIRRAASAAACAVLLGAGLAACSPGNPDPAAEGTTSTSSSAPTTSGAIPKVDAGPPLPADARVMSLGDLPDPANGDCELFQTLPPDSDAEAEDLVPKIYDRGRLIVGLDQGSNLFSFRDPVSGELEGFDVDLAKEIARDIFGDPERVEFRSLTSGERIAALQDHRVDVVVKSMSITCERREHVRFSAPYYSANQRLLTLRGSEIGQLSDLDGKRVCVAEGTTSAAKLRDIVGDVTVLSVNTWADCLVAIQQEQVDAITTDDAILAGMVAQDPNLVIVGDYVSAEPYGVGIPPNRPGDNTDGLVRQVNGTLERIRSSGRWREMYNKWLSQYGSNPVMPRPVYSEDLPDDAGLSSSTSKPQSSTPPTSNSTSTSTSEEGGN
ncbi:MAG TPA: glutamate ABC transporter substrate-binding protein [Dietzia timorensis]|uniref:Glutamate ABC transporter substrate-binding protein n=1 Tax=Dietzia timorensis TaxID=499555 RepID=A0A921JZ16_9ACTN|nr:glutamate ABC transporter substrate-binding protein [Dietzia timorensis]HJE91607.1 glutamate ABC transporter substrate-binding protein [Dietzia timorensis]